MVKRCLIVFVMLVVIPATYLGISHAMRRAPMVLTAELAKKALLQMDYRMRVLVPGPADKPIVVEDADHFRMGIYECNLKQQTFQASAFYPTAPRHKFNHVRGIFQQASGKWMAKVTDWESGH